MMMPRTQEPIVIDVASERAMGTVESFSQVVPNLEVPLSRRLGDSIAETDCAFMSN